jgi:hypothetical protein
MAWPIVTTSGQFYQFDLLIPVEPSSGSPVIYLGPRGGIAQGVPAIEKGDPGLPPTIDTTVTTTVLAYGDPTPASASWTVVTPPSDSTAGTYRLNLAVHEGQPGANGSTTLTVAAVGGTAAYKKIPQVNAEATGFEFTSQKVGGRHYPASLNNTANGNSNSTLGVVSIAAGTYDFDYRVEVEAQTIVTATGANCAVDLVARLNGETGGNDIGLIIGGGYPAGSADGWDKVSAGAGCTVHLRTEQQSGSDTYSTSSTTTRFVVKVRPVL